MSKAYNVGGNSQPHALTYICLLLPDELLLEVYAHFTFSDRSPSGRRTRTSTPVFTCGSLLQSLAPQSPPKLSFLSRQGIDGCRSLGTSNGIHQSGQPRV